MFPCHVLETAGVTCLAIPCKHTLRIFCGQTVKAVKDVIRLIPVKSQDKSVEACGSESRSLGTRSFRSLHALCLGRNTPPKLFLSKGGFGLIQEEKEITKSCFHFTHGIVRKSWKISSAGSMFVTVLITSLEIRFFDTFHWHACHPLHETVVLRVCDTLGSLRWSLGTVQWTIVR